MLAASVTGAFARGQMAFGQTLQICAEGAAISITLDARGNPVKLAQLCPECFGVAAGLPPAVVAFGRPDGRWHWVAILPHVSLATQSTTDVRARGPPAII